MSNDSLLRRQLWKINYKAIDEFKWEDFVKFPKEYVIFFTFCMQNKVNWAVVNPKKIKYA